MGKVTHHSIELHWDLARTAKRQGPQGQWAQFCIEEEDPRTHAYGVVYMWVPLRCGRGGSVRSSRGAVGAHSREPGFLTAPWRFRLRV